MSIIKQNNSLKLDFNKYFNLIFVDFVATKKKIKFNQN